MLIKEVSEKYNITKDTLRYYEKCGVIPEIQRDKNGIRVYSKQDLDWIEFVICMRSAGLTIDVLKEYAELSNLGDSTFKERHDLLETQKIKLIEERNNIDLMINKLEYKVKVYEKALETGVLSWDND